MGIFSSLFQNKPQTSKMRVAGLAASAVDYVLQDAGLIQLESGSLILDKNMQVSFRSGKPKISADVVASVPLGELSEFGPLKLAGKNPNLAPMMRPYIDRVIYATIRQFEKQSPAFAALPAA